MNDLHHCGRKLTHCLLLLLVVLGLTSQVLVATSWAPSATSTTAKSPHYDNPSTKKNSEGDHKGLVTNSSLLYECKLSYLQLDMSLIKFSINYLEHDDSDDHDDGTLDEEAQDLQVVGDFKLVAIDFNTTTDELRSNTKLNASLPFVFFINGFNTFGPGESCKNATLPKLISTNSLD